MLQNDIRRLLRAQPLTPYELAWYLDVPLGDLINPLLMLQAAGMIYLTEAGNVQLTLKAQAQP